MLKRVVLLIVLVVASGCDHWIEKLEPQETGFARHVFDLLQHRDFAALEDIAGPGLRSDDFPAQLSEMAAMIPAEATISSDATSVNVSTTNGYTKSSVNMVYQFPSGWLQFDIASEGSEGARTLTWISLQPTAAQASVGFLPLLALIPLVVMVLTLIGTVMYRRRIERREALRTTPDERGRRARWSMSIENAGTREPWLYRLIGIRRVALNSALGVEECRRRLKASIDRELILFQLSEPERNEFQGQVRTSRFRIFRKRSVIFSSKYQAFLYGRFVSDVSSTGIRCWIGPQRLVLGLAAAFLLFAWVMFNVVGIVHAIQPFDFVFLLPPIFVTVLMAAGFAMQRKRMLTDGPYLLDFLSQTLEASEAPVVPSGSVERVAPR
jgi:hypothetical protein